MDRFINQIINEHLLPYKNEIKKRLIDAFEGRNKTFIPYKTIPKHYIISIYEPLELHYVLLGNENYGIKMDFVDQVKIDNQILKHLNLDVLIKDNLYKSEVIELKRDIEYRYLNQCLNEIEDYLKRKIQLYITQHTTEVSFDISKMKTINSDYLWENLDE